MTPRILIIDDSLTVRKLLELALTPAGYQLDFAATGADGIARARTQAPDVILLDFILPDMRGVDVCRALEHEPSCADRPIILMSGRPEGVRAKFVGFPAVVDFAGKPFSPEAIAAKVSAALRRGDPTAAVAAGAPSAVSTVSPHGLSHAEREQAANAVYARLRDRLAQVPLWAAQLGSATPAPYFARRLLTPETVDGLIEALAPFCERARGPRAEAGGDEPQSLLGDAATSPLVELLRALAMTGRTGELVVGHGPARQLLYLRRGKLLLASSFEPSDYLAGDDVDVSAVPAAARAQAEGEQRRSGKPLLVSLCEEGQLSEATAAGRVQQRTRSLVDAVLGVKEGTYTFAERSALPAYVERWGQAFSVPQAILERLRRVPDWSLVEQAIPSLDVVLERAGGFSRKLQELDLDPDEQAVLALVDGRIDARTLLERAARSLPEGLPPVARLCELGLLRRRGSALVRAATQPGGARAVLLVDPDLEGFLRPIAAHLARVQPHWPVVIEAGGVPGGAEALRRVRPRTIVVSGELAGGAAESILVAVAGAAEPDGPRLVAVLDAHDETRASELERMGFDRVLVKPLHFSELEAVLAPAGARRVSESERVERSPAA